MKDWSNVMEWELAREHNKALKNEDYQTCDAIQKEVDKRIENSTIDHFLMEGFRYYNSKSEQFEGDPNYKGLNGLFNKYQKEE